MERIPTAVIAEENTIALAGLRGILEPHLHVLATVQDGQSLVEQALITRPDLIVLEISMPKLDGVAAARIIKRDLPSAKFLFVTMHSDAAHVHAAFEAGASGYFVKSETATDLVNAIRAVIAGRIYIGHKVASEAQEGTTDPRKAAAELHLTHREEEVLQLLIKGKRAKEIGSILGLSPRTVEFHRDQIRRRLGLGTLAEVVRYTVMRRQYSRRQDDFERRAEWGI
ncbi:MAG TPA: response regulator transcription factor [Bryobacteraceae bacterium]|nr:response regulator transcription factor [Bryobacteraceae bacterium]